VFGGFLSRSFNTDCPFLTQKRARSRPPNPPNSTLFFNNNKKKRNPDDAEELTEEFDSVRRQSAAAHCSLVEIYMSDLCDTADAEAQCEAHVARGLELAPESPEPWISAANLRIVQRRPADALEAVDRSVACWMTRQADGNAASAGAAAGAGAGAGAAATTGTSAAGPIRLSTLKESDDDDAGNSDGDDDGDDDDDDEAFCIDDDLASLELRFATARLYMELGAPGAARRVLETVLDSDDTLPDVWYLFAEAVYDSLVAPNQAAAAAKGQQKQQQKQQKQQQQQQQQPGGAASALAGAREEALEAYSRAAELFQGLGMQVDAQVAARIKERTAELK
jgi:hypothetical protein